MIANPDINSLIWMYRHYENLAKSAWHIYPDMVDAYFMYDYYMEMAEDYEQLIISNI